MKCKNYLCIGYVEVSGSDNCFGRSDGARGCEQRKAFNRLQRAYKKDAKMPGWLGKFHDQWEKEQNEPH